MPYRPRWHQVPGAADWGRCGLSVARSSQVDVRAPIVPGMARFTKAELQGFRGAELPDLVGPGLKLLFVGINPGLWTAAVQPHFDHPANRFYPALALAGILERPVSPSDGMTDADREAFVARGLGITNLASRATARADELSPAELRAGGERLVSLVE